MYVHNVSVPRGVRHSELRGNSRRGTSHSRQHSAFGLDLLDCHPAATRAVGRSALNLKFLALPTQKRL